MKTMLLLLITVLTLLAEEFRPTFKSLKHYRRNRVSCACNVRCRDYCKAKKIDFKDNDSLIVHLWTRPITKVQRDSLYALLQDDGIRVLYCDTASESWTHGIVVTPKSFSAVFKGFESSYPHIRGYEIPERYKTYVNVIRFPDPKIYGYYRYNAEYYDNKPFQIFPE